MLIKVNVWTVGKKGNSLAILLRLPASSRCVPIYVEENQAHALLMGMGQIQQTPPHGPELVIRFARMTGLKFIALEIIARKTGPVNRKRLSPNEKYNAILRLAGKERKFSLEAEIIDALTIAVKKKVPVFIDEAITQEDAIGAANTDSDIPYSIKLANLKNKLQKFIQNENYEKAAQIRDEINRIKKIVESGSYSKQE